MGSNMGKGLNFMETEITTRGSSSTACQKAMESIFGTMEVLSKAISSKVSEMATEFGLPARIGYNLIKGTTLWTKNQDMDCTNGITDGFTRATSTTIPETDTGNSTTERANSATEDSGKTDSKSRRKSSFRTEIKTSTSEVCNKIDMNLKENQRATESISSIAGANQAQKPTTISRKTTAISRMLESII